MPGCTCLPDVAIPILLSPSPNVYPFPTPLSSGRGPLQGDLVLQPLPPVPPPVPHSLPGAHAPTFPPGTASSLLPPWGAGLCKFQLLDWRMNGWGRGDWPLFHLGEYISWAEDSGSQADVILTGKVRRG